MPCGKADGRARFGAELQGRILPVQEIGICNRRWWKFIYKGRMCGKLEFMRNRASRDGGRDMLKYEG